MDKLLICFVSILGLLGTVSTEDINLLSVNYDSELSILDLWNYTDAPLDSRYERHHLIDDFDVTPPTQLHLVVKDTDNRHLFLMRFDPSGVSKDLSSLLSYSRYLGGTVKGFPFQPYITTDVLEIRDPVNSSDVILAHGRYNGTLHSQLICFTANGSPFPLVSAIEGRQINDEIFFEKNYRDAAGFNQYFIRHSKLTEERQYIRSIAVFNKNNTNVIFTLEYAPWEGQCRKGELKDIKDKYSFKADGKFNRMDVIKVRCLKIFFSELVYKVSIYLAQPADDYILGPTILVIGMYDDQSADSTTSLSVDTTNVHTTEDSCDCKCPEVTNKYEYLTKQNLTYEQLEEALKDETEKLKKELTVDKATLSSTTRRKISAPDNRPSSGVIGWFGGLIIGLQGLFIISLDVCWYFNTVRMIIEKFFKN